VLTGEAFEAAMAGNVGDGEWRAVKGRPSGCILQLHKRVGYMRIWFGQLVSDEKHDGGKLTVDGEQRAHDELGREKE
jgi:hypothetical protein